MRPTPEELRELERQVERSQLFTHTALSQQSNRINEIEAFLYGLIDVLVDRGVTAPEVLEGATGKVRERWKRGARPPFPAWPFGSTRRPTSRPARSTAPNGSRCAKPSAAASTSR